MIYFNTLKERVQQRWIIIHENIDQDGKIFYFPHSSVWTTYRRMYDEWGILFTINEVLIKEEWNMVIVEAYSDDDWRVESFETKLYFKANGGVITSEFEYTEAMDDWIKKFWVSIDS